MREVLLSLHIESLPEGGFVATSADLPGLVAKGSTLQETIEIAQDVARRLVESYEQRGDPLPLALAQDPPPAGELRIPITLR